MKLYSSTRSRCSLTIATTGVVYAPALGAGNHVDLTLDEREVDSNRAENFVPGLAEVLWSLLVSVNVQENDARVADRVDRGSDSWDPTRSDKLRTADFAESRPMNTRRAVRWVELNHRPHTYAT
jgi:hypothetical protein